MSQGQRNLRPSPLVLFACGIALFAILVAAFTFSSEDTSSSVAPIRQVAAVQPNERALLFSAMRRNDRELKRTGPAVYLTFDDGPSEDATMRITRILRKKGVVATFFVVGRNVSKYPDLVRRTWLNGNSIQNHTWWHPRLVRLSSDEIRGEIDSTNQAIKRITGSRPGCVRPPYDEADRRVEKEIHKRRMELVRWTLDSNDWRRPGAAKLASNVVSQVQPGSIILMHDAGGINRDDTVNALGRMIDRLKARGYHFGLLCE